MKSYLLNCVICIMDPTSVLLFLSLLRCWRTLKVRPWGNKHTWAFTAWQSSPPALKTVPENQSSKEMMKGFRWCRWQTQSADFITSLIGRLCIMKSVCAVKFFRSWKTKSCVPKALTVNNQIIHFLFVCFFPGVFWFCAYQFDSHFWTNVRQAWLKHLNAYSVPPGWGSLTAVKYIIPSVIKFPLVT